MRLKVHTVQNPFCTVTTATQQTPLMQSHATTQPNLVQFKHGIIFKMLSPRLSTELRICSIT